MKLVDVYDSPPFDMLYQLLEEREPQQNISHKRVPRWGEHVRFVRSRPYMVWYAIVDEGATIGAVYLTKQREIGVGILRLYRGQHYGQDAIQELMRRHPGRFLCNINPTNTASIALFRKLGFGPEPIQFTFERPA